MDKAGIKQWNVRNYWKVYPKSYYKSKVEQKQLYVLKRTDNNKVVGAIVLLETYHFTMQVEINYLMILILYL